MVVALAERLASERVGSWDEAEGMQWAPLKVEKRASLWVCNWVASKVGHWADHWASTREPNRAASLAVILAGKWGAL